jgi:hypothetical protein
MAKKTVLAIGIDPAFVDLISFPGYTAELLRGYIDTQIEQLRTLSYEVESCLIDLGDTAEAVVAKALRSSALRSKPLDCVVIGAGLRQPPERLLLFESVLNLVHALAPDARICFNTNPADTAEAVQRWVEP